MGFRKADDFYIALGQSKISTKVVANKVMQRLKRGEAVEEEPAEGLIKGGDDSRRRVKEATSFGIKVKGVDEVAVRLAKCCRPVPGDEIVGYVSLGRGITVHREDCRNVEALRKAPERFTEVSWDGDNEAGYRVELQVDAWDRHRLLEDLSRTFAEAGINILEAQLHHQAPDGEEPLRGRGRRHRPAQGRDLAAAEPRLGLRRLSRHSRRLKRAGGSQHGLTSGQPRYRCWRCRVQGEGAGPSSRRSWPRPSPPRSRPEAPSAPRRRSSLWTRPGSTATRRPPTPWIRATGPSCRTTARPTSTTSSPAPNGPDGGLLFQAATIGPGQTTTLNGTQYLTQGTYPFFCNVHPLEMSANLQVSALGTPVARPKIDVILGAGKLDKIAKKGKVPVTVKALTQADGVEVALKLGKTTVGSQKAFSLTAGQSRKLALKLNKSGKSKLGNANSAKLKATGEVPFGSPDTAKRTYK